MVAGGLTERDANGMRIVAVLPCRRFKRAPLASVSSTLKEPKLSIEEPVLVV
jgi:hypothetical protein